MVSATEAMAHQCRRIDPAPDCIQLSSASPADPFLRTRALVVMAVSRDRDLIVEQCVHRGLSVDTDPIVDLDRLWSDPPEVLVVDLRRDVALLEGVCAALGSNPDTGLILILGGADPETTVRGLTAGADDCVGIERGPAEISARIQACARRTRRRAVAPAGYRFGGWYVARQSPFVRSPAGAVARLSPLEHALLLVFLRAPNQVLKPSDLNARLGLWSAEDPQAIDWRVRLHRLRRRLMAVDPKPPVLQSVRGRGYMFVAEVEEVVPID